MAQKPSLPKGTRDFGPIQMYRREYILDTIKHVFRKYGFMPLETPAMENLSVLTGKYGDEGDQLLFRILNSGDFLNSTSAEDFENGSKAVLPKITKKGLKYDLTVPFARYVVMNRNEIAFPFKRYQIQPVWRGDRPQKGRYQEFYQCDADVVGTDSLICEAELLAVVEEVFQLLKFNDYSVSLSSRKILEGIAEICGAANQFSTFCTILDKLDKIGLDRVVEELQKSGIKPEGTEKLKEVLSIEGDNEHRLNQLASYFDNSEVGMKGISEARETLTHLVDLGATGNKVNIDFTLARGLSYYTGMIYEVKPTSINMGTITAGGRYDNLTGVFGMPGVSGVGISFGIDRIYDTLAELDLFPEDKARSTKVLITNFDQDSQKHAISILSALRKEGVACEIFPESAKLKKQMAYADKKRISYVLMVGSREIETGVYTLRDMSNGDQMELDLGQLLKQLSDQGA
ncbi:histidine--tRNA ligase [Roseivirga misakiensis]|uniref:Histidine--tRNA ligase n=1 Tax=Roseivirga misakiensis TaxID=1563681 RepID=A0A1E5SLL7_9BACT|nr:histidine--tRNA ligase [Roseivirga misakiensis]OEJ99983.1 histidine--tRNA ligase [Roseivirga misakiensis]